MPTAAQLGNGSSPTELTLAFLAACLVFAGVHGVAASTGLSTRGLGAGDQVVASCGTGMTLGYSTAFDGVIAGYVVDGIDLSSIPSGCLAKHLSLTFDNGNDHAVGSAVDVVLPAAGVTDSISIDPSSNIIDAGQVSGVSVVVS